MHHISGLVYDGLWINGLPEVMASKLKIVFDNNSELDKKKKPTKDSSKKSIYQGIGFSVGVECHNESGRVIPGNTPSHQLHISYRWYTPSHQLQYHSLYR